MPTGTDDRTDAGADLRMIPGRRTMRGTRCVLGAGVVAAVGAITLALAPPGTAEASPVPGYESCIPGLVCVYDRPDGNWVITSVDQDCEFHNIGLQGFGDQTSSAQNFTDKHVYLLDWNPNINDWNTLWHMPPGTTGNMPAGTDNRTDAIQVCA
jgi:hypothetical protein